MSELFADFDVGGTITDQMYLEALKARKIVFTGEIDEDFVMRVVIPLLKFQSDENNSRVTLYLHSPGGNISDALVLCNIIDNYRKGLDIVVLGYACSMATTILCAGNDNPNVRKLCYPFSYGLIHAGEMSIAGEYNVIKEAMEFQDGMTQKIWNYMVQNTSITKEELAAHSHKQWYLTAEEMLAKGLVDEII